MKLVDLATGSDWIVWIVFVIFAVFSIILLSGHGSWFISGYNTASKEEKEKYDEKKLFEMLLKKDFVSVVNELKSMYEKEAPIEEDLRDFCRDLEKEGIISKNNDDSLCEN